MGKFCFFIYLFILVTGCGFSFVLFCFALTEHKCSSWVWGYRSFYKTADTFSKTTCSLCEEICRCEDTRC